VAARCAIDFTAKIYWKPPGRKGVSVLSREPPPAIVSSARFSTKPFRIAFYRRRRVTKTGFDSISVNRIRRQMVH